MKALTFEQYNEYLNKLEGLGVLIARKNGDTVLLCMPDDEPLLDEERLAGSKIAYLHEVILGIHDDPIQGALFKNNNPSHCFKENLETVTLKP
jgi:hypothetical protein